MVVGAVAGAVYVQSSRQAQQMVEKGKSALKNQLQNM